MKKALWMVATVTAMGLGTAAAATNGLKTIDADSAPMKTQTVKPAKKHARTVKYVAKKAPAKHRAVKGKRPIAAHKPAPKATAPTYPRGQEPSRLDRRQA